MKEGIGKREIVGTEEGVVRLQDPPVINITTVGPKSTIKEESQVHPQAAVAVKDVTSEEEKK